MKKMQQTSNFNSILAISVFLFFGGCQWSGSCCYGYGSLYSNVFLVIYTALKLVLKISQKLI